MDTILTFVKNYFIFMMVLFLFSYLTPKESYRKYFQFFIGVLMVAILMQPVMEVFRGDEAKQLREQIKRMETDIEEMTYYEKGEDIFERFLKDSGVDTQASGES